MQQVNAAPLPTTHLELAVPSSASSSDEEIRANLCADGADEKVWFNVQSVLSEEECVVLRTTLDSIFDEQYYVRPGENGRTTRDHSDEELNAMLWSRIEPHVPKSLFGRECVGLHPLMRLMRYEEAGSLSAHVDGTLELGTGASLEGLSFLTGMFYLNHDFSGGATRFFRSYEYCDQTHKYDGEGVIDIAPRAGMLNIFQHNLVHMGLPVSG
eukprot:COSAG06_NODE_21012_length_773_cov_1.041543_1_plen_211_part_01